MKGVFFSADFVKDSSGSLKLLELNTNTAISFPEDLDFSELQQLLANNSITTLHVLYTDGVHAAVVSELESFASTNSLTFEKTAADQYALFAPEIAEPEGTFILRLSYDGASIFDSEYAAQDINTLKLFTNGADDDKVIPFYYYDGEAIDKLSSLHTNENTLPDYVIKNSTYQAEKAQFVKIGGTQTNEEKLDAVKGLMSNGSKYIAEYHQNADDLTDGYANSYRLYGVMYLGADGLATFITLGSFSVNASLDLAESLPTAETINILEPKHFLEYSTNFPFIETLRGIPHNETIKLDNETSISGSELQVGTVVDSYAIETMPDSDDSDAVAAWSVIGDSLPTTTNSASTVVSAIPKTPNSGVVTQIVLEDGSSTLVGNGSFILRYSPTLNNIKFESTYRLEPGDKVILSGEVKKTISAINQVVLNDAVPVSEFNVEDIDMYIVGEQNMLMHNSPCFIAGTQVNVPGGHNRPIEELGVGDPVLTYNFDTNEIEEKQILSILQKDNQKVIRLVFEDNAIPDIYPTYDHPFYVEGKGWSSFNPELTLEDSGMHVNHLAVGDSIRTLTGTVVISEIHELIDSLLTVYNLTEVEGNNNFFVYTALVHNRFVIGEPCPECCPSFGGRGECDCGPWDSGCCPECVECFVAGTEVTLANGDVKNIEDIIEGEEVLSSSVLNGKQEAQEVLQVTKSSTRNLVTTVLENGTVLKHTLEHPHIDHNGQIVSYRPDVVMNKEVYETRKAYQLEVGTILLTEEGEQVKVTELSVEEFDHDIDTFIIKVKDNANFYANGILTHNK